MKPTTDDNHKRHNTLWQRQPLPQDTDRRGK